jgi:hypothetical protein
MVIRWPGHVTGAGGLRSQFTHVTDVGPTILDIAGIPQPTHVDGVGQQPMTGVSFAGSMADPDAAEHHTRQYFENFGNRAMYQDGWWLSMRMPRVPWRLDPALLKRFAPGVWDPDEDPVELYYLPDDFSQAHDLAASNPEKVKELQALFWEEAEKYHIKPLLAGFAGFFGILPPLGSQTTYTYYGDVQNVAPGTIPPPRHRSPSPARSRRWSSTWLRTPTARTSLPSTSRHSRHTQPAASTPDTSIEP